MNIDITVEMKQGKRYNFEIHWGIENWPSQHIGDKFDRCESI